jgi:hypothetical protein
MPRNFLGVLPKWFCAKKAGLIFKGTCKCAVKDGDDRWDGDYHRS